MGCPPSNQSGNEFKPVNWERVRLYFTWFVFGLDFITIVGEVIVACISRWPLCSALSIGWCPVLIYLNRGVFAFISSPSQLNRLLPTKQTRLSDIRAARADLQQLHDMLTPLSGPSASPAQEAISDSQDDNQDGEPTIAAPDAA
jgi:hypothetical protein